MGSSTTVSFHLSPEQEQLKLGARQFAEQHLRPLAAEVRKESRTSRRRTAGQGRRDAGAAPKSISATAAPNPPGPGAVHLKLPRARSVAAVVVSMACLGVSWHTAILHWGVSARDGPGARGRS